MVEIIFGLMLGFILLTIATHPRSPINKKLPSKKIKNLQVFPRISVSARNRVFHFHHWIILAPIYLFFQNVIHSGLIHGLFLGGIAQGLMFKDRFRLIFRQDEYHQIKKSSFKIPFLNRKK